MAKAVGGKNVFGHAIGILMLESRFPRIPGDVGNATTWNFPVLYKVIENATPDAVVRKGGRGYHRLSSREPRSWKRRVWEPSRQLAGFSLCFSRRLPQR